MAVGCVDNCCDGMVGLSFRRSEADVKKGFTDLVVEAPLTVRELDFSALRGRRGGSMVVCAAGVGSQYWVEKGSMAFVV